MLGRSVLAAVLFAVPALASEIALTRVGDVWKYFPGLKAPSAPADAWASPGFDDSKWGSGRSGFSLGYLPTEASPLPIFLTNSSAVFFRRTFIVTNQDDVNWLTLRIDYGDAFVAYLNGHEIARRNLPGPALGSVAWTQLATGSHPRGQTEEIDVSGTPLNSGANVLAVEVHSASALAPALCFSAELMANFNRAPYLQNLSSN